METVFILALFGVWLIPSIICGMKGKPGWSVAGFLLSGWLSLIPACRLAKPTSWWAVRFYDPAKMADSRSRFMSKYERDRLNDLDRRRVDQRAA